MIMKWIIIVSLCFSTYAGLSQNDTTSVKDSLGTLPDIRLIRINQPEIQPLPNLNMRSSAFFCRMEAGLKRKTGIGWNIGLDVK